jgi:hypothetical protein
METSNGEKAESGAETEIRNQPRSADSESKP